jgi:GNAT superfamily N-acetyltransferase
MIRTPQTPLEWESYYDLRYRILRKPWQQPRGSERNDGDDKAEHFAFFIQNDLVGVGRLDFTPMNGSQIRFMAVDDKHQGKGIGKKLMMHMEELAQRKGCSETVLHAREIALPFYQKLGYHTIEKSHLLFDEIQHYLMSKKHEHSR